MSSRRIIPEKPATGAVLTLDQRFSSIKKRPPVQTSFSVKVKDDGRNTRLANSQQQAKSRRQNVVTQRRLSGGASQQVNNLVPRVSPVVRGNQAARGNGFVGAAARGRGRRVGRPIIITPPIPRGSRPNSARPASAGRQNQNGSNQNQRGGRGGASRGQSRGRGGGRGRVAQAGRAKAPAQAQGQQSQPAQRGRGGRGRGGRGRGGRGRGGKGGEGKEPSKEELDAEMDRYMGKDPIAAKLDQEMDEYRSTGQPKPMSLPAHPSGDVAMDGSK